MVETGAVSSSTSAVSLNDYATLVDSASSSDLEAVLFALEPEHRRRLEQICRQMMDEEAASTLNDYAALVASTSSSVLEVVLLELVPEHRRQLEQICQQLMDEESPDRQDATPEAEQHIHSVYLMLDSALLDLVWDEYRRGILDAIYQVVGREGFNRIWPNREMEAAVRRGIMETGAGPLAHGLTRAQAEALAAQLAIETTIVVDREASQRLDRRNSGEASDSDDGDAEGEAAERIHSVYLLIPKDFPWDFVQPEERRPIRQAIERDYSEEFRRCWRRSPREIDDIIKGGFVVYGEEFMRAPLLHALKRSQAEALSQSLAFNTEVEVNRAAAEGILVEVQRERLANFGPPTPDLVGEFTPGKRVRVTASSLEDAEKAQAELIAWSETHKRCWNMEGVVAGYVPVLDKNSWAVTVAYTQESGEKECCEWNQSSLSSPQNATEDGVSKKDAGNEADRESEERSPPARRHVLIVDDDIWPGDTVLVNSEGPWHAGVIVSQGEGDAKNSFCVDFISGKKDEAVPKQRLKMVEVVEKLPEPIDHGAMVRILSDADEVKRLQRGSWDNDAMMPCLGQLGRVTRVLDDCRRITVACPAAPQPQVWNVMCLKLHKEEGLRCLDLHHKPLYWCTNMTGSHSCKANCGRKDLKEAYRCLACNVDVCEQCAEAYPRDSPAAPMFSRHHLSPLTSVRLPRGPEASCWPCCGAVAPGGCRGAISKCEGGAICAKDNFFICEDCLNDPWLGESTQETRQRDVAGLPASASRIRTSLRTHPSEVFSYQQAGLFKALAACINEPVVQKLALDLGNWLAGPPPTQVKAGPVLVDIGNSTWAEAFVVAKVAPPPQPKKPRGGTSQWKGYQCRKGHRLEYYIRSDRGSNNCDGCGRSRITPPEHVYRCHACDFDLCTACYIPEEELRCKGDFRSMPAHAFQTIYAMFERPREEVASVELDANVNVTSRSELPTAEETPLPTSLGAEDDDDEEDEEEEEEEEEDEDDDDEEDAPPKLLDAEYSSVEATIEGTWTGGAIVGTTLLWNDSRSVTIDVVTPKKFTVSLNGASVTAVLEDDGKLHWSDGDVWEKVTTEPPLEVDEMSYDDDDDLNDDAKLERLMLEEHDVATIAQVQATMRRPPDSRWEVKVDHGWEPFNPGVPFVGVVGEEIEYKIGGQTYKASFKSDTEGMQRNISTSKRRQLRKVQPAISDCIIAWPDALALDGPTERPLQQRLPFKDVRPAFGSAPLVGRSALVGRSVEARRQRRYDPATVERDNGDGTVTIRWDDGDIGDRIKHLNELRYRSERGLGLGMPTPEMLSRLGPEAFDFLRMTSSGPIPSAFRIDRPDFPPIPPDFHFIRPGSADLHQELIRELKRGPQCVVEHVLDMIKESVDLLGNEGEEGLLSIALQSGCTVPVVQALLQHQAPFVVRSSASTAKAQAPSTSADSQNSAEDSKKLEQSFDAVGAALALRAPRVAVLVADRGGRWARAAAQSLQSLAEERPVESAEQTDSEQGSKPLESEGAKDNSAVVSPEQQRRVAMECVSVAQRLAEPRPSGSLSTVLHNFCSVLFVPLVDGSESGAIDPNSWLGTLLKAMVCTGFEVTSEHIESLTAAIVTRLADEPSEALYNVLKFLEFVMTLTTLNTEQTAPEARKNIDVSILASAFKRHGVVACLERLADSGASISRSGARASVRRELREAAGRVLRKLRSVEPAEATTTSIALQEVAANITDTSSLEKLVKLIKEGACTPFELGLLEVPEKLLPLLEPSSEEQWPWTGCSTSLLDHDTAASLASALLVLLSMCETFPVHGAEWQSEGLDSIVQPLALVLEGLEEKRNLVVEPLVKLSDIERFVLQTTPIENPAYLAWCQNLIGKRIADRSISRESKPWRGAYVVDFGTDSRLPVHTVIYEDDGSNVKLLLHLRDIRILETEAPLEHTPVEETEQTAETPPVLATGFLAGTKVMALFKEEGWYRAEIEADNGDGTYTVNWDNWTKTDRVKKAEDIKLRPPRVVCKRVQVRQASSTCVGIAVNEYSTGLFDIVDQDGRFLPGVSRDALTDIRDRSRHSPSREFSDLSMPGHYRPPPSGSSDASPVQLERSFSCIQRHVLAGNAGADLRYNVPDIIRRIHVPVPSPEVLIDPIKDEAELGRHPMRVRVSFFKAPPVKESEASPSPSSMPSPVLGATDGPPRNADEAQMPGWTRIAHTGGFSRNEWIVLDMPIDRIKAVASKASQVQIQIRDEPSIYVRSKPNTFPIEDIRAGHNIGHGRIMSSADASETWTGTLTTAMTSQVKKSMDLSSGIFWASHNVHGLHWLNGCSGNSLSKFDYAASGDVVLELFVDAEEVSQETMPEQIVPEPLESPGEMSPVPVRARTTSAPVTPVVDSRATPDSKSPVEEPRSEALAPLSTVLHALFADSMPRGPSAGELRLRCAVRVEEPDDRPCSPVNLQAARLERSITGVCRANAAGAAGPSAPVLAILRRLRRAASASTSSSSTASASSSSRDPTALGWENGPLNRKLADQLARPLIATGGLAPSWVEALPLAYPFLFQRKLREQLLHCAGFGTSHAVLWLQNKAVQARYGTALRGDVQGETNASIIRDHRVFIGKSRADLVTLSSRENILRLAEEVVELTYASKAELEVLFLGEGFGTGVTQSFYADVAAEFTVIDGEGECCAKTLWATHSPESIMKHQDRNFLHSRRGLFPQPHAPGSPESEEACRRFHFLGRLMAKALRDGFIVPLALCHYFLAAVLHEELPLAALPQPDDGWDGGLVGAIANFALDLRSQLSQADRSREAKIAFREEAASKPGWPEKWLKDTSAAKDMCFKEYMQVVGVHFLALGNNGPPLCQGGADRAVTIENLDDFVEHAAQWWLKDGIINQINAFRSGVEDVCTSTAIWAFEASELRTLFCGRDTVEWTAEDLRRYLIPRGNYHRGSPAVEMLIGVLVKLSPERRSHFLEFVTACPRLPPGGLASSEIGILPESGSFPRARTCTKELFLPEFSSAEQMAAKLNEAVDGSKGLFDDGL